MKNKLENEQEVKHLTNKIEERKNKKKLKKSILFIVTIFIGFFVVLKLLASGSETASSKNVDVNQKLDTNDENEINQIIDVSKFSRITQEELINLMGNAEYIDEWQFDSANGKTYNAITLVYNNGLYEFMVINNNVVRFTAYTDEMNYSIENVFKLFGITPSEKIELVQKLPLSIKYHLVSDRIGEVWIIPNTSEEEKIDILKVTYDMRYF